MDIAHKIGLGITLSIALMSVVFALFLIFYQTPKERAHDYSAVAVLYLTKAGEEKDASLALSYYDQGLQASRHALAHSPFDYVLWGRHIGYLKMVDQQDQEAYQVLKILHRLHPHRDTRP